MSVTAMCHVRTLIDGICPAREALVEAQAAVDKAVGEAAERSTGDCCPIALTTVQRCFHAEAAW